MGEVPRGEGAEAAVKGDSWGLSAPKPLTRGMIPLDLSSGELTCLNLSNKRRLLRKGYEI